MSKLIEITNGPRRTFVVDSTLSFWRKRGWTPASEVSEAATPAAPEPAAPSRAPVPPDASAVVVKGDVRSSSESEVEDGKSPAKE